MSKRRDLFAAAALQGLLASGARDRLALSLATRGPDPLLAAASWGIADAMLAHRATAFHEAARIAAVKHLDEIYRDLDKKEGAS